MVEFGESIHLEGGKFKILGEDEHSIFRTYQGYSNLIEDSLSLDLLLTITGGTGFYSNARGYLKMNTKVYEPHSQLLFFKAPGYIIPKTE